MSKRTSQVGADDVRVFDRHRLTVTRIIGATGAASPGGWRAAVHTANPHLGCGIGCLIALHSGGFSPYLARSGALVTIRVLLVFFI